MSSEATAARQRIDEQLAEIEALGDEQYPFLRHELRQLEGYAGLGGLITEAQCWYRPDWSRRPTGEQLDVSYMNEASNSLSERLRTFEYHATDTRWLVEVAQCHAIRFPESRSLTAWAVMSDCAFMVAPSPGGTVTAHIGYNTLQQFTLATQAFEQHGADMSRAQYVANSGHQNPLRYAEDDQRTTTMDDLAQRGISADRVYSYDFKGFEGEYGRIQVARGLAHIICTDDNLVIANFDMTYTGSKLPQSGEAYDERIIARL
ncbi:MAG TPA: hypothetical protein VFK47_07705 [Ktedonobacteraceae bacterium]|nr:hypothetical protein [Ktedonobacteraceae bacterium]